MNKAEQKNRIASRAEGRCEYCKSPSNVSPDPFSLEHIVPQSRGGDSSDDNLAYSCQGCNNHKYTFETGVDPVSNDEVPLFNPRESNWKEHFSWCDDFTEIVGNSKTGRATIERMKLNRSGVVGLRKVLILAGIHPLPT